MNERQQIAMALRVRLPELCAQGVFNRRSNGASTTLTIDAGYA